MLVSKQLTNPLCECKREMKYAGCVVYVPGAEKKAKRTCSNCTARLDSPFLTHCNTAHCNTAHCNTAHGNTAHCTTHGIGQGCAFKHVDLQEAQNQMFLAIWQSLGHWGYWGVGKFDSRHLVGVANGKAGRRQHFGMGRTAQVSKQSSYTRLRWSHHFWAMQGQV